MPVDCSRFVFLLVPEFSLYGLVPAIEALRIANQNSETTFYQWSLRSVDGKPVRSSSGISFDVDGKVSESKDHDAVVVCAGNHPLQYCSRRALRWLSSQAQHGKMLLSIDSGSFLLAEAGLLNGYRATVHWEVLQLFEERYPEVHAAETLFVTDGRRITCAGGIAALDMMLHLIQIQHGEALAQVVANGFVHLRRSNPEISQIAEPHLSTPAVDRRIRRLLQFMEAHLQKPLEIRVLAERASLSLRQLERLVQRHFSTTPRLLYSRVRLDAGRVHLFHGKLSVKEIAALCGFESASAFCRAFKSTYGTSPLLYRQQHSFEDLARFRSADTLTKLGSFLEATSNARTR
jgi:transcriptional regulator GlxA family with amidase domain